MKPETYKRAEFLVMIAITFILLNAEVSLCNITPEGMLIYSNVDEKKTLAGLSTFIVKVTVDKSAKKYGINEIEIYQLVKNKCIANGIKVEDVYTEHFPTLFFYIYALELQQGKDLQYISIFIPTLFRQFVTLNRESNIKTLAVTWQRYRLGIVKMESNIKSKHLNQVNGQIESALDEFLADFLNVNPELINQK